MSVRLFVEDDKALTNSELLDVERVEGEVAPDRGEEVPPSWPPEGPFRALPNPKSDVTLGTFAVDEDCTDEEPAWGPETAVLDVASALELLSFFLDLSEPLSS